MTFIPPLGPGRLPPPTPVAPHRDGRLLFEEWAQAELLEQRTVIMRGALDDVTAGNVATQLMFLDGAGDEEIRLRIDSADGSLAAAASLIDVIDELGVPVDALATRAEGPALAVLAVCERRSATPHATLRMHEPDVKFDGRATALVAHLEHYNAAVSALWVRVSAACRLTPEHVAEEFASGRYLSPADAQAYGLIDEIAAPSAEVRHLRRPMGFRPPDAH
jgi:ATP-dependent Clp protease protease subunit